MKFLREKNWDIISLSDLVDLLERKGDIPMKTAVITSTIGLITFLWVLVLSIAAPKALDFFGSAIPLFSILAIGVEILAIPALYVWLKADK